MCMYHLETCRIEFGFCKRKETKCVNFAEIAFNAIFFIVYYLQSTTSFYDMLEPNTMNYHFLA